jgi:hypothetical protein
VQALLDGDNAVPVDEKRATGIQFCEAYEDLLEQCLENLTQRTQLGGFDDRLSSAGTPEQDEARRAQRNYAAAFSALRLHARGCILRKDCEYT